MLDLRPVFFVIGLLLAMLAALMLIPMLVDLGVGHEDWRAFLSAAVVTAFMAGLMMLTTRQSEPQQMGLRQAFLLTTLAWILIAAFAALPLAFADRGISYVDSYFESMSGLTTTGSTVLADLDHFPPGLLMWRSLLQGVGGVGIIVMGLAILPFLRIGGMQLFRTESSDRSEKVLPRATQIAANIGGIYLILMITCAIAYWAAGMSAFDAIAHAMPTISTGGFGNYDASFGYFKNPTIEWIGVVFMLIGGGSFTCYILASRGRPEAIWRDSQMQWYGGFCAVVSLVLGLWHYTVNDVSLHQALRHAAFSVVSVVTTTGFAASDYGAWGNFSVVVFFALMLVGGCTGSTAGGIKVFRYQILFGAMRRQFFGLLNPHGVRTPTFNGQPVPAGVPMAVMGFFFLYGLSILVVAMGLALMGLDMVTALSAATTAVSNVGPGLGEIVGPSGNFATLPDGAKVLLSAAMLLGRLELFTVLIIFSPDFWRG